MIETTCAHCNADLDVDTNALSARAGIIDSDGAVIDRHAIPCWQNTEGVWVTCSCGFTDGWWVE